MGFAPQGAACGLTVRRAGCGVCGEIASQPLLPVSMQGFSRLPHSKASRRHQPFFFPPEGVVLCVPVDLV